MQADASVSAEGNYYYHFLPALYTSWLEEMVDEQTDPAAHCAQAVGSQVPFNVVYATVRCVWMHATVRRVWMHATVRHCDLIYATVSYSMYGLNILTTQHPLYRPRATATL